jgi:hypothetical protein
MKSLWACVLIVLCHTLCHAQESEGKKQFKNREGGIRIGYTVGTYTYRHSGADVYFYRINNGFTPAAASPDSPQILTTEKPFKSVQNFRGIHIGGEITEENYQMEVYFTTRKATTDARYTFNNGPGTPIQTEHEQIRMRYNSLTFALGYPFKKVPIAVGMCMDIGSLRTQHKFETHGNKWQNWFFTYKIISGDETPKTPVATYGAYLNIYIGRFMIKVNQNFALLDGDLNSQSYKYTNLPTSSKVFPMANTSISATFKF